MKQIKKIYLLSLTFYVSASLFCSQPAPTNNSFPVYYNTQTKTITGPSQEANKDFNSFIEKQAAPEIKFSNNFLSGIKKFAQGKYLNDILQPERNALYGVLLGINMIDALQACVIKKLNHRVENTAIRNKEDISNTALATLNTITKELFGDKRQNNEPDSIKNPSLSEILQKIKETNPDYRVHKAMFEYIAQKIQQTAYNAQSSTLKADPENNFSKEFNKHSTITNRILENKSTFKDRLYLKVTKTFFSVADWVRTKVLRKSGILQKDGNFLYDILKFENINADYIKNIAKDAYKDDKKNTSLNENFVKSIMNDPNNANENYYYYINKKTITINGESYDIFSTVIQQQFSSANTGATYASVTQYICDKDGKEISHTFKINYKDIDVNNVAQLAKNIITQSLNSLTGIKDLSSQEQVLTLLKDSILNCNSTEKDIPKHIFLTESSIQVFNSANIKSAEPVINTNKNTSDTSSLINADDFDSESASTIFREVSDNSSFITIPSQSNISSDTESLIDSVSDHNSFNSNEFFDTVSYHSNDEGENSTVAELAVKQNILQASVETLTLKNIRNQKTTFNFDEAVKDNEFHTIIKNHLDNLSKSTDNLYDKNIMEQCILKLETAFENRQPELSSEDKEIYDQLKKQLDKFVEKGNLEINDSFYKWVQDLYDNNRKSYNLIIDDIDSAVFKENITTYNAQLSNDLTIGELVRLKQLFGDFILGAQNYGYGSLSDLQNPRDSIEQNFANILVKAGINSPEKQQQLFDNLITIDKRIQDKLFEAYPNNSNSNILKNSFIESLTQGTLKDNSYIKAFNALSNESKINFINNLPNEANDLTQKQRNDAISVALQKTIDNAQTETQILTLQKEMFARGDVVLQALQDKIKKVLIDKYNSFNKEGTNILNFKSSILEPEASTHPDDLFPDYSRAFKTLSFSDQKAIYQNLGIQYGDLKSFQKNFLADKIFYAKTIDELNKLKTDINSFNKETPGYFINQDLNGKHGLTLIGDAFTQQTQKLILQKIHNNALFTDTQNGTRYFVDSLLDFKSQDPYASAFRQLSLLKQNEIAQTLNLNDPSQANDLKIFKEYMNKALIDQANMLTNSGDLGYLLKDAKTLETNGITDSTILEVITTRQHQAESNTLEQIKPEGRTITFNQNGFVSDGTTQQTGQDIKPIDPKIPTVADIQKTFNDQTLSKDFSVDNKASQEEKNRQEEEYRREKLAQDVEKAAQEEAAKAAERQAGEK